ncbi:hypothetical protein N7G274_006143 [Stereocaulon virgatum]|uniref:KOW domain-containing protein n=1 Tax=Stereocaulon virgatum TaxID=373712 RepID=A0ABR4ACS1_9LECA
MKALRRPLPSPKPLLSSTTTQQCRHASAKNRKFHPRSQEKALLADLRDTIRKRRWAARTARREEWFMGPLAPRRDLVDEEWGCVSVAEMTGVKARRVEDKWRARMGWEDCLVEVGDRVVIVAQQGPESRDRGRIGTVIEVRKISNDVVVEDLNLADMRVPYRFRISEPSSPKIRTIPLPIPFASIRLIYPLRIDGRLQDCIISKLIRLPGNSKKRYIANSDKATGSLVEVPIPAKKDDKPEKKDHEIDTLRFEVEEQTWTPTLLRAPMPGSVIDELRGKYSKFRTRHEPGYALALENREKRKAAYKAWVKSGGGMLLTPSREARLKERSELMAKGKPELKAEVLERIGEVMAGKGIEMTEERRKEVERNLEREGEGVLRPFVLSREEEKGEETEGNEEGYGVEQDEMMTDFERLGDGVVEEDPPSSRNDTRV